MQKRFNHFMLLFLVLAVVMTSAFRVTTVHADEGVTEPPTGESTPPPDGSGTSTEEAPPVQEPAAATEVPAAEPVAATEVPAVEEPATATEVPAAEEPAPVPNVLEQLPEGTDVVAVNAAGEVAPLASAEAAEIIVNGDPIWCPDGQAPTPGANGCTPSQSNFASLITVLAAGTYTGNGTVWVESSYNSANDSAPIVFDGAALTNLNNHNLTVQGGWNGTSGSTGTGAASSLDDSLSFVNWTGDITIRNLNIDVTSANTTGAGLYVDTVGNITLNGVNVVDDAANTKASGDGADLINTRDPNVVRNVTVDNSRFNGNSLTGLYIDSYGAATLNNVQANSNGYGLDITADAGIGLTGVTAASNSYFGGILDTTFGTGAISVTNSNFGTIGNGNGWTGLHAVSGSTITLATVTASDNGTNGAYLLAQGNISVINSTFSNNVKFNYPQDPGLFALSDGGNIGLSNVTANNNQYGAGAVLGTYGAGTITVNNGSQFNQNGTYGIQAASENGAVALNGVTASSNGIKGAYLLSYAGTVSISNSTFNLNGVNGARVISGGPVTLNNVTADHNGSNGVEVYSITTEGPICDGETPVSIAVTVNGGTFTNNGSYGLMVKPGPQGTLSGVGSATFFGNALGDYLLDLNQEFEDCTCDEPEEPPSKEPNIVDVPATGGDPVEQDCEKYSGTILKLPNGTWVKVGCPFEGLSKLEALLKDKLPGPLGANLDFETAIALGLIDKDGKAILTEGTVTLNFLIPEGASSRRHSVLFWDSTLNDGKGDWMQLPPYEIGTSFPLHPNDPKDTRTIVSGVQQVGNTVTATVNFPGVFVLVGR